MSLLPSLFRQTDIPMQLGAKVERPAPKKPDPIKEFGTGDHMHDGSVWPHIGVDYAADLRDTWRNQNPEIVAFWNGAQQKSFFSGEWEMKPPVQIFKTRDPQRELTDAQPVDEALKKDFFDTKRIANDLGIVVSRAVLEANGVLPRGRLGGKLTTGQALDAIDWMLMKIAAAEHRAAAAKVLTDEPQSPAQEAKAKKMAEIQKAKQELRSMVKKPC